MTGSQAFIAPIELLRELNEHGIEPGELAPLIAAIEEFEELAASAVMSTTKTGLSNVVWMIPVPGGQRGPRIKVAIDPPHAKRPGGKTATVPFDSATLPLPGLSSNCGSLLN